MNAVTTTEERRHVTRERLGELLFFEPETGCFYWRASVGSRARAGDQAGSLGVMGYWMIRLDGRLYYAHRLVWLWVHGEWPTPMVDHANGNRADNRPENLRLASMSQNLANARVSSRSRSGVKGVSWNSRLGRWHAYIGRGGKRTHIGFFDSIDDASAAYAAKAREIFGEFANPASWRS